MNGDGGSSFQKVALMIVHVFFLREEVSDDEAGSTEPTMFN